MWGIGSAVAGEAFDVGGVVSFGRTVWVGACVGGLLVNWLGWGMGVGK